MDKSLDDNVLSMHEKYGFNLRKYTPGDFFKNAKRSGVSAALQDDWKVTQIRMGSLVDQISVYLAIEGEKRLYRQVRDDYRRSKNMW